MNTDLNSDRVDERRNWWINHNIKHLEIFGFSGAD